MAHTTLSSLWRAAAAALVLSLWEMSLVLTKQSKRVRWHTLITKLIQPMFAAYHHLDRLCHSRVRLITPMCTWLSHWRNGCKDSTDTDDRRLRSAEKGGSRENYKRPACFCCYHICYHTLLPFKRYLDQARHDFPKNRNYHLHDVWPHRKTFVALSSSYSHFYSFLFYAIDIQLLRLRKLVSKVQAEKLISISMSSSHW